MEQAEPGQHTPVQPGEREALHSLLRWYVAMGVDAPVGEVARDSFAAAAIPAPILPAPAPLGRAAGAQPVAADALVAQAEASAAACASLAELNAAWATLPGCGLAATASQMIVASGRIGAPLMLIGGAPDSDDERQGDAFAGAKGRLLDRMLAAIGLTRADVLLGNVVPWRPPGNRAPTPLELSLCLPFARRLIALSAPAVLLCLGERAAQPLLASRDPVSRLRGRWISYEGDAATVKTLVTFSLDYLLKQPLSKRRAWADLLMIADALPR